MPDFTLDGKSVVFEEGQTIMQAACNAGIYIPHLCFHEEPGAHGSCRVCVVKVNGRYLPACNFPAKQDIKVLNIVHDVQDYRRQLLELLFMEGNHLCPPVKKARSAACSRWPYFAV
jgi:[NiFe] hydrogenase diaphorase moiety small subunit